VNLELVAREPEALIRQNALFEKLSGISWHKAIFILFWEGQSQLSAIAYVALVAFGSFWLALGVMLAWSLTATVFFCAARERGYPNLLSTEILPKRSSTSQPLVHALGACGRAWLSGVHAFIFARCSCVVLAEKRGCCRARTAVRLLVLVFGLTFFGVSTAEHMLRTAGYAGKKLVRLSLIGPFLNVPYRVLVSTAVVALAENVLSRVML
jgi:hypothetical protein